MSNKRALIVGINYTGSGNDLRGCINDAMMMDRLLRNKFGFTDVKLLIEKEATTAGMKAALENLVAGAVPGDQLFFHYSGHGSQIYDGSDADFEPDGMDEILCPYDLNFRDKVITDDYLKAVFNKVPNGVSVTVVLDCCHSGSGMDQDNQYQSLDGARAYHENDVAYHGAGGRFIPPPADLALPGEFVEQVVEVKQARRDVNQSALLITGCESNQTSADAFIGNNYFGACTYLLNEVLSENAYDVTYKALVDQMNDKMVKNGFTQRPELNGPEFLFGTKFLSDFNPLDEQVSPSQPETPPVEVPPAPTPAPAPVVQAEDHNSFTGAAIIGAVVIAFVLFIMWMKG